MQPDALLGQTVGGSYVIKRLLGTGGMGAVYLAQSSMLAGQQIAVKVLLPSCSADALARFRAEVFAAGKIHDPNIVRVFDAGHFDDGRMYMLMEYCDGGSLFELLQNGPLPLDHILHIAGPIASVLDEAHTEAKITHRDIKPANILLVRDAGGPLRAKLGDFGIAKLHADSLEGQRGTQQILGSPGYFAPEQCDFTHGSGGVDHRADVFALAAVLYEMTTGKRPFAGNSVYELIQAVLANEPIPSPRTLRPELPKVCDAAIMAGLEHHREARTQSAKALVLQFAQGVPNGLAKLAFVAPRLITAELSAQADTISQSIGPAALAWADAATRSTMLAKRRRRRNLQSVGIGMLGVALGATGMTLWPRTTGAAVQASASASVEATAPQFTAAPAATVVTPPQADAMPATSPPTVAVTAPPAPSAPPSEPPAMPAERVTPTPPSRSSSRTARAAAAEAPSGHGTLRVVVTPFADVAIDNVEVGSAPVQKTVTAGTHVVRLTGPGGRIETVYVTVTANKPALVSRSWNDAK